jgi:hypothetical protein
MFGEYSGNVSPEEFENFLSDISNDPVQTLMDVITARYGIDILG